EHDDANRALMGSNMQRQAVPLLYPHSPIVRTGMEVRASLDSGTLVTALRAGIVEEVDATHIVVKADCEVHDFNRFDTYQLQKFKRTNQDTCINQRPLVNIGDEVNKGQILADGMATKNGILALGVNATVAFIPWNGYNFEDAIVVSERVIRNDAFTSVHVVELETQFRETKLGPEELTRELPSVDNPEEIANLDEDGIIKIGSRVRERDILVGKITPKGEQDLSPSERLIRAIFGQKAGDVKDASLRAPTGMDGVVIDVKVFSRKDKTERTRREIDEKRDRYRDKFEEKEKRLFTERDELLRGILRGQKAVSFVDKLTGEVLVPSGRKLSASFLNKSNFSDIDSSQQLVEDLKADDETRQILRNAAKEHKRLENELETAEEKLMRGDDL
ncbi:MAG: DNA-directed RNA polymerase subunit beta, partial [Candidatus Aegiribacteria sp.]|nr:DNA-directed RNA polymerase subunit beta [Candidatus Aegiribacteria sp.]